MISAKVMNLRKLEERVLKRLPPTLKAAIKEQNQASAKEFMDLVISRVPVGDVEDGNIKNTVKMIEPRETAVVVTIGSKSMPYPLHIEVGYRAVDGTAVPGQRFWYRSRSEVGRKHRALVARAFRLALEAISE